MPIDQLVIYAIYALVVAAVPRDHGFGGTIANSAQNLGYRLKIFQYHPVLYNQMRLTNFVKWVR